MQLTDNEMWSPKTVGLPKPSNFEPSEPFGRLRPGDKVPAPQASSIGAGVPLGPSLTA